MNASILPPDPVAVSVAITRVDNVIRFNFSASPGFINQLDMYNHLRTALTRFFEGSFVTVRFASQQRYADARLLTCPDRAELYHDPLVMLRNPVNEVNQTCYFELHAIPFKPRYICSKAMFVTATSQDAE